MRILVIAILFAGLLVPIFGQDANAPLYRSLNESINSTYASSSSRLRGFDNEIVYNAQGKAYGLFKQRYEALSRALQDSEIKLSRLIQLHDTPANIEDARKEFETLVKQLEQVKNEYDAWFKTLK